MIGRSNSGGGGGISSHHAVMHIVAPAGSTVSLTKGGITVAVLDGTQGLADIEDTNVANYYYTVSPSNYGEWEISILTTSEFLTMSSGKTKSLDVEISTNRVYDIYIFPDLCLVPPYYALSINGYNGAYARNNDTWITQNEDNMRITGSGRTSTTGQGPYNWAYTTNSIPFSYYNRLIVTGTSWAYQVGNTSSLLQMGFADWANGSWVVWSFGHGSNTVNGALAINVNQDVSNVTANTYCYRANIGTYNTGYSANASATITNFRLTVD